MFTFFSVKPHTFSLVPAPDVKKFYRPQGSTNFQRPGKFNAEKMCLKRVHSCLILPEVFRNCNSEVEVLVLLDVKRKPPLGGEVPSHTFPNATPGAQPAYLLPEGKNDLKRWDGSGAGNKVGLQWVVVDHEREQQRNLHRN
jgi:hypothetical protein